MQIKNHLDSAAPTGDSNKQDNLSFLSEVPIADLFPHCTVMFTDICGFWLVPNPLVF
jgi:hypothetical protein